MATCCSPGQTDRQKTRKPQAGCGSRDEELTSTGGVPGWMVATASWHHFALLALPSLSLPCGVEGGFSLIASPCQASSRALEKVLARLKGVRASRRGWTACCPAHGDRVPSLSIGLGEHGQVLLKCFAGCSVACIVQALGLTMMDLFPDTPSAADGRKVPSGTSQRKTLSLLDLAREK
jgi:hypothetical protein